MKAVKLLFAALLVGASVSLTAQNRDLESIKAEKNAATSTAIPIDNEKEVDADFPWLQSPYLNVEFDKATVGQLTIAFAKWKKDNPDHFKPQQKLKDEGVEKFSRKLHLWQAENGWNDVPTNAHQRMDAFRAYDLANPVPPMAENNHDGNWKLLGPTTNPEEIPYNVPAFGEDASADNASLGRINCIEFSRWDTLNIWVGTSTGGIWKTWNGGKNWVNISMNMPIMEISDIAVDQSNNNIIYVAVGDRDGQGGYYGNGIGSRLYKTGDGGITWAPVNANFGTGTYIMNLWCHPQRPWEIVVVKTNGVYKSVDGGANWTQTLTTNYVSPFNAPNDNQFRTATYGELNSPERIYALYRKRYSATQFAYQIRRSDNFGSTWTVMDSLALPINQVGFNARFQKLVIAPSDPNVVYMVTSATDTVSRQSRFGMIARTLDGGRTWQSRGRYPSVPNIMGWILGDSTDVGSQDFYDMVINVDPQNRDRVFVGGVDMWGSTDGGMSFSKTTFWLNVNGESAHADHHWGEYQPISSSYFLATDGGLYKTRNLTPGNSTNMNKCYDPTASNYFTPNCYKFPTTWEFVGNGISNNEYYAIAVSKSDPSMIMGGTQDNGTHMRRGGKWYSVLGGDGFVPMIHPTNPNIYYATVYYGQTFKTTDGGRNYQFVSLAMDTIDRGDWLTPMTMVESNPNTIIQARGSNIWRTTNGGNTWQQISNFPQSPLFNTNETMAVAQSNPNIIMTVRVIFNPTTNAYEQGLYKTTNGGTTWTRTWNAAFPVNPSRTLIIHPTDPNKVWIGFTVGYAAANPAQANKLFYSADGGTTWTNITLNLPAVPVWSVAAEENSPVGAFYVGTAVGIFYKDNTMAQFKEFQVGMPRGVMATDLKIHTATGRIYAGTYGRGIWGANLYSRPYEDNPQALQTRRNLLLNVSPNPAQDMIRVNWDEPTAKGQTLSILDLHGRVMYTQTDFQGRAMVDVSKFISGMYTVQLKSDKEMVSKRFSIVK